MADFMQAIKWMKKGEEVRRPHWDKDLHWKEKLNVINNCLEGDNPCLDFTNYEATDWEIYEEKKTLSDKIITQPTDFTSIEPICLLKDVKQHLKEFIGTLFFERTEEQIKEKAKEIFGEGLI